MSENNYGALMMKATINASDNINQIVSPGVYPVPPSNSTAPDATGGVLIVYSGSPIRRVFISDATIVMTSTYDSAASKWSDWHGAKGRLLGKPRIFKSSDTYIPTPGTKSAFVEVQAAGGPGGNATNGNSTTASAGAGGGAGGFLFAWIDVIPASAPVVVGSGGISGNPGGDSSFNGVLVAKGGNPGTTNAVNGGNSYTGHARGNIGGDASGGDINEIGGAGFPAFITQGIPSGGNGGASHFSGNSFSAGANGGAGNDGLLGAGGAGAAQRIGGPGYGGGKGGDGIVIVWEMS